ncbi:MAG TPA: nucleoside triphosphate pyrophosphatase [Alphaproteobacteria bacterium]|nr:nucleoside triphosphate pyrophosphatase [Alphaproteobacteria bacterium]
MTEEPKRIAGSRSDLVLASGSTIRAQLLCRAAVPFLQDPPEIDEAAAKAALCQAGAKADEAALELARLKAMAVCPRHPNRIVLGTDQLLICEGEWLDKPGSRARAFEQLERLSGRRHTLATALILLRAGRPVWSHLETPEVQMRQLTTGLITAYLDVAGESALQSVGAYQLEGPGAQLLESITGDVFAVLGLPMLPLLAALRREGLLP